MHAIIIPAGSTAYSEALERAHERLNYIAPHRASAAYYLNPDAGLGIELSYSQAIRTLAQGGRVVLCAGASNSLDCEVVREDTL